MKLNEIPPFATGQRVVCIKAHSQGILEVGKEYIVLDCIIECKCGWSVNVGIISEYGKQTVGCHDCYAELNSDGFHRCHSSLFAPIKYTRITFEKVYEQVEVSQN